jgi:hypothetical protein
VMKTSPSSDESNAPAMPRPVVLVTLSTFRPNEKGRMGLREVHLLNRKTIFEMLA